MPSANIPIGGSLLQDWLIGNLGPAEMIHSEEDEEEQLELFAAASYLRPRVSPQDGPSFLVRKRLDLEEGRRIYVLDVHTLGLKCLVVCIATKHYSV